LIWGESAHLAPKMEDNIWLVICHSVLNILRTCLACVKALGGEKKILILDFLFIGVYINLICSTAVRSQHLYPKRHEKGEV